MTPTIIWSLAGLVYGLFWWWYVGFKKKITPEEVATTMRLFDKQDDFTEQQRESLQRFLLDDDGKDFVMVNLLLLNKPAKESRKKLGTYQKIFLGQLLRTVE